MTTKFFHTTLSGSESQERYDYFLFIYYDSLVDMGEIDYIVDADGINYRVDYALVDPDASGSTTYVYCVRSNYHADVEFNHVGEIVEMPDGDIKWYHNMVRNMNTGIVSYAFSHA